PETRKIIGLKPTAIDDAIADGTLPEPYRLSGHGKATGWLGAQLIEVQRKRQAAATEPCCRLFPVQELNKPANVWCKHCQPGKGWYEQRPPICRGFACGWLLGHMSDNWFPKRARMVIKAFHKVHGGQTQLTVVVDPRVPNKWREQPYLDD